MAGEYLTCPFCGMEFLKQDTLCQHGCPLGGSCHLVRCPNCLYEYPEQPAPLTWWERLCGRKDASPLGHPAEVLTARELRPGERVSVLRLGGARADRQNTLAVFGIVPGAQLELVQQQPVCVVRVGETELALDLEIASDILVQRNRGTATKSQLRSDVNPPS